MDFTRLLPGVPKAKVHSRIIMAPQHAKAYLAALNENIKKFESKPFIVSDFLNKDENKLFENLYKELPIEINNKRQKMIKNSKKNFGK